MTTKLKVIIVLPAFNEAKVIGKVLDSLKEELKKLNNIKTEIVVVDDGSRDRTAKVSQEREVMVLRHIINRGLGASITTGLEFVKQKEVDILVTMDSDGQHDPKDIRKVIEPIISKKADVVIGSRFLGTTVAISRIRKLILKGSNLVTYFIFGIKSSDTQSGFRAFSKKAIQEIKLKTQRMEVSSEIFSQIKKHSLKFFEVPIKVMYTPYSKSKGQSNLNALNILVKLILRLAR